MAKAKTAANILDELREVTARTGGKFYTEAEKIEAANSNHEFTFTKIVTTDSEYGPRWELTTKDDDKERVLSIPGNEDRDPMMKALAKIIKRDGKVGPLILSRKEAKNGNAWYWLTVPTDK